jgi:hypothetical protein
MFEENWRTVDFRPAPPGWHTVHIDADAKWCRFERLPDEHDLAGTNRCGTCLQLKSDAVHKGIYRRALAGWLVQEEMGSKHRRVVPAVMEEDGELWPQLVGLWNASAWYVSGPDDPAPTVEEIIQERDGRAEERATFLAEQSASQVVLAA